MSEQCDFVQFETVLSYCYCKTHSQNYDAAMRYGRLSGFFADTNKLTPTGSRIAKFLSHDTKAADPTKRSDDLDR